MATIKRAGNRIITKVVNGQRRVSCSCCPSEEGCCMYSADQLGVGYTAEDLPDEIMWFINVNLEQRFAWPKVGDKYVRQFCGDEECYEAEIRVEGGQWLFGFDNNVPPAYWFGSNCLFQEGDEQGFKDNFADTYTIDFQSLGPIDELSRVTLCIWGGSQSGYLAYYDGNDSFINFYYSGPPHKWIFIRGTVQPEEGGGVWEKDDPQSGPEGTYSPSNNAGDFAGIGTVTVSEP
jgi:hypothetical protein